MRSRAPLLVALLSSLAIGSASADLAPSSFGGAPRIIAPPTQPAPSPGATPSLKVLSSSPTSSVVASITVRVADQQKAADEVIARATALGGYFSQRQQDHVVLRVPTAASDELLTFAAGMGAVVDRSFEATDRRSELDQVEAQLASRTKMLDAYFKALSSASSAQGLLQVESQLASLVQEVERLKGSLILMRNDLALARITVFFQFQDRRAPTQTADTSFGWINSMNLSDLIADFQWGAQ